MVRCSEPLVNSDTRGCCWTFLNVHRVYVGVFLCKRLGLSDQRNKECLLVIGILWSVMIPSSSCTEISYRISYRNISRMTKISTIATTFLMILWLEFKLIRYVVMALLCTLCRFLTDIVVQLPYRL